jgi:hypothetical protein
MYHGILIDQEFMDIGFPNKFKVFSEKFDGSWRIYGIEVEDSEITDAIIKVQDAMKVGNWYAHFYNEENLIVVFKDRKFMVKPDESTWQPVWEYGKQLGIPEEQLDFQPNNFQDESSYFGSH